jgi:hypothetical protein
LLQGVVEGKVAKGEEVVLGGASKGLCGSLDKSGREEAGKAEAGKAEAARQF